jgi:hypothetical protein
MLNQVADGVWVRQSGWVWSNAIAVRGEGGLILVDPGIDGSDLNQLAEDLDQLGIPVSPGFRPIPTGTTCPAGRLPGTSVAQLPYRDAPRLTDPDGPNQAEAAAGIGRPRPE